MIDPTVFIGEPLLFKNKIKVYPPTVRQVLTSPRYGQYLRVLTISQYDIEDELFKKDTQQQQQDVPSPFEFLLINCYHSPQFLEVTKEAFQFFLHLEINFFYEQKLIILGELTEEVLKVKSVDELLTIGEEDYFELQNLVRMVCGISAEKPPEPKNPNEDPRIAAIKAKARARDRLKAKQGAKNGISTEACLTAICCMGIGLTPLNIGEMSYAAIGPLMKMSQEKEKYDIDVRSLLAGADSKKVKPKYWIRNSDKE